jgi:hypothetical protein
LRPGANQAYGIITRAQIRRYLYQAHAKAHEEAREPVSATEISEVEGLTS